MSVKNIIKVTNAGISPVLSITQGTDAVEFEFTIADYNIPSGSSAVAYNIQPTGNIVNQLCSIAGNIIKITPRAYFFLRGKNYMQFQITNNKKNLFSFLIEVWCSPNISEPEVSEVQDPTVVTQVLSKLGEIDLKIDSVDTRLGNRINNIVANNNPTEGNTELIDIRSGYDGTTYPSAGEAVRKQIGSLSEDIYKQKEYIFKDVDMYFDIGDIPNISHMIGSAIPSSNWIEIGVISSIPDRFDSYYVVLNVDCDIYIDSLTATYFAITYGENYTKTETQGDITRYYCENPIRVRSTENNLPYESNKLHIKKGSIVIFTITRGDTQQIYGLKTLLALNNSFKQEVISLINNDCLIQYAMKASPQDSDEQFDIYIKTNNGYIKYEFIHSINTEKNCDSWRIYKATYTDDELNNVIDLTTSGEWEMAVRLKDRPDFSGGYIHGDEMLVSINFFCDGINTEKEELINLTSFEKFIIVETSNVYDPNDNTTLIAKHGKEYIFSKNGLQLNQSLLWLTDEELNNCYMAMFPVSKEVTDKIYTNNDYQINDIVYKEYEKVTDTVILGNKFTGRFAISKYLTNISDGRLYITDNSNNPYNKMYYFAGKNGQNVKNGDRWETTTIYELNYKE